VQREFEGFWFKPAGWLLKRVVLFQGWWSKMKHRLGRVGRGYYVLEVTHRLVYKVSIEIERHLPWVRR